jgi:hypothetical protein
MLLLAHRGIRLRSTIFPSASWEVPFIVFALVISGWIGYTSAESIFANIAGIELLRLSCHAWLVAGLAGIATGSTALWVLVEGFFSTSAPARIDSLAYATSTVAIGNLAILSAVTLAFARSWPRGNEPFPYMALHHPATHVANDHFLQTGLLFIAMTTAYIGWRTLNWLSIPRTAGEAVTAFAAVALPFTVASAFVAALTRGTDKHIDSERERVERVECVEAGKAKSILTRAGEDVSTATRLNSTAKRLNDERLKKIKKRFKRAQIGSKILGLYVPAAIMFLWHRFFPPTQTNPDESSPH